MKHPRRAAASPAQKFASRSAPAAQRSAHRHSRPELRSGRPQTAHLLGSPAASRGFPWRSSVLTPGRSILVRDVAPGSAAPSLYCRKSPREPPCTHTAVLSPGARRHLPMRRAALIPGKGNQEPPRGGTRGGELPRLGGGPDGSPRRAAGAEARNSAKCEAAWPRIGQGAARPSPSGRCTHLDAGRPKGRGWGGRLGLSGHHRRRGRRRGRERGGRRRSGSSGSGGAALPHAAALSRAASDTRPRRPGPGWGGAAASEAGPVPAASLPFPSPPARLAPPAPLCRARPLGSAPDVSPLSFLPFMPSFLFSRFSLLRPTFLPLPSFFPFSSVSPFIPSPFFSFPPIFPSPFSRLPFPLISSPPFLLPPFPSFFPLLLSLSLLPSTSF